MPIKKQDFYKIWDRTISRAITLCCEELDDNYKNETNFRIVDLEAYADELYDVVKRKEKWLQQEYLPNNKSKNSSLDMHKISSIFCRSIIGYKPFIYNMKKAQKNLKAIHSDEQKSQPEKIKWEIDNIYINYKLAFLVSEGIALDDLLFWANEKIKECAQEINNVIDNEDIKVYIEEMSFAYRDFIIQIKSQGRLFSYVKSERHDTFCDSIVISLMKNDWLMRDFDYLSFATILFQWQEYTKIRIFTDILQSNNYAAYPLDINWLLLGPRRVVQLLSNKYL